MVYGFMFTSNEPFRLPPQDRDRLEQILRTTSLSAGLMRRARVLLLLTDGVSLRQIQAQTGMSPRYPALEEELARAGTGRSVGRPACGATEEADRSERGRHPGGYRRTSARIVHALALVGATHGLEQCYGHTRRAQGRAAASSAAVVHGQSGPEL